MDKIQKILIKAGEKDLAQEYYKKAMIQKSPSRPANVLYLDVDGNLNIQIPYVANGERVKTKAINKKRSELYDEDKKKFMELENYVEKSSDELHRMTIKFEENVMKYAKSVAKKVDNYIK